MKTLRREIHPEIRVLDEKQGIVEYIASNETIDSYGEIIRADGWKFDDFRKNAPFVDSHNYGTIGNCLGCVLDFSIQKKQLVETVKWAIDVPENQMAQWGFQMTKAGYLKAVSVGFMPISLVTPYDRDLSGWNEQCEMLNVDPSGSDCRCIYTEQQQKELSACVIGANPDAVARAFKAGILDDAALETFSQEYSRRTTATATDSPGAVAAARRQARERFLVELQLKINSL